MSLYGRTFRGSHKDKLDRLQKYATLISLHNSTSFAKTLQSEQSTVIELVDESIVFTDQDDINDSDCSCSNSISRNSISGESNSLNSLSRKTNSPSQCEEKSEMSYGSSCGLYNPGQNICFMNAVIQTLINLPYITPCLLNGMHKSNCKLRLKSIFCSLCLLESLTQKAHSVKGAVNNPFFSITKKAIWNKYVPGKQQDSHEFLRYLVESFSTPIGTKSAPDSYKKNLIGQAFHGTLKSTVKCLQCKYTSEKLENFLDIALDITKDALEGCIVEFIKPQQLTGSNKYHCPKCKNKRDATISLNFGKLPVILCIALKRFNFGVFGFEKTVRPLKYPQNMDLSGKNYELSALVCHLGHSLYSGHYIAYAKGGHGFWSKFDDSHVSVSEKKQVLEQTKTAYLLFYVQQNVGNYQDILVSSADKHSNKSKSANSSASSANSSASNANSSASNANSSSLNASNESDSREKAIDVGKKPSNVAINEIKNPTKNNRKGDGVRPGGAGVFSPFARVEGSRDLATSYGIHQISTWDGKERDKESIRRHGEALAPRIAKVDEYDVEYDKGKLKKVRRRQAFKGQTGSLS